LASNFDGCQQNDSFEFINCVLENLHKELKKEADHENLITKSFKEIIGNSKNIENKFLVTNFFVKSFFLNRFTYKKNQHL
jgi:ubiquitin C-terminal hydrolase